MVHRPARTLIFPEQDCRTTHVNDLRATSGRRAGDADVTALVHDLTRISAEFRELWRKHDVAVRGHDRKLCLNSRVGLLHLTSEVQFAAENDVKVLVLLPTHGTDAREKLDLLQVLGHNATTRAPDLPRPPPASSG